MRILVAGGTGHTGERLVRRLLAAGHEVRVLSRESRRDGGAVLDPLKRLGAVHFPGDCTRRWTLWQALEGCDVLIGCAHIRYAEACVQACRTVGVDRYLQMSSTRRFTRYPCVSSREVIAGERAISESGLRWTILRATMIFGGRRDANLTRMVNWFSRHRWFPLFAGGRSLTQPVFVEDLLDAFMASLKTPVSEGRDYTLAGPQPISMRELVSVTAQACGVRSPLLIPVPRSAALAAVGLLPLLERRGLTREQILRMDEDKDADITPAIRDLVYTPRSFAEAIRLKAGGGAEIESLYPTP